MSENVTNNIDGIEIKESDLTQEQRHHKNHVVSLRNKITKLQFEIDDLMPSLQFHENKLIELMKTKAEEILSEEKEIYKEAKK
tara:strand:+ start:726 stop:974 length:249 start_codon:yes stop_codon:yes gene_type:complete